MGSNPQNTLLLDSDTWDLVVDAYNNIAMAQPPYALAQDVASSIKLFKSELWYDTAQGIPYWDKILGKTPPLNMLKSFFNDAALTVPGVITAQTFVKSFVNRTFTGQVQVTSSAGIVIPVEVSSTPPLVGPPIVKATGP